MCVTSNSCGHTHLSVKIEVGYSSSIVWILDRGKLAACDIQLPHLLPLAVALNEATSRAYVW